MENLLIKIKRKMTKMKISANPFPTMESNCTVINMFGLHFQVSCMLPVYRQVQFRQGIELFL